jgi:SAM-dependent methyltransferase
MAHPNHASSVAYYERHAQAFFQETIGVDMRPLYQRFLPLLPEGARILDAGCGAGRDLRAFRDLGYAATGFDASPALVALARQHAGDPVHCLTFQSMTWRATFHGIWACASLLHVPRAALGDSLRRLTTALLPGGTLYASFKYGTGEREKDGRTFTDLDEAQLACLLAEQPLLAPLAVWTTADRRPNRDHERWLNVLLRKVDPQA